MEDQIGAFQLDHLIGRGATGEVWLGWEQGALRRPVAIKRVRSATVTATGHGPGDPNAPAPLADLAGEAEILAGMHHPHLVPILAVVDDGAGLALVMPYLAGGSLATLLEERGTLSAGEMLAVIEPLADAVDALARRGMVHGDLKPGNVMLTGDGEPVLVDVGLARVTQGAEVGAAPAGAAGTPEYLDPALTQGGPPGGASEVYSLAVIAYECLTGRVPHRGEPAEVLAVAAAGVHQRLVSWPTVPRPVAEAVEAALDPDPARRPASPGAFAAELRQAVEAQDGDSELSTQIVLPGVSRRAVAAPDSGGRHTVVVASTPPDVPEPAESGGSRWCRPVAAAAVGVVALLGALTSGGSGSAVPRPATASVVAPVDRPSPASPLSPASPTSPVEAQVDVDGDHVADLVQWDGHHLTVTSTVTGETRAYRMGRPGDQILFGDWDGDGAATPALYRPTTGEVLYADRFPAEVGERESAVRVEHLHPGGIARVEEGDATGADRVVLVAPS